MDVGGKLLDAEFIEARFRWNFSFCCWRLEYSWFLVVGVGGGGFGITGSVASRP